LSKVKPNQKVADLGSGDGRLVIAFAHSGAKVHGFEINPLLIQKSRTNIKKAKLENKAQIHLKSFWTANLSQYDIIYIYGMQHIMKRLEKKLQKELKPGAKIISNVYKFPNWPIKKQTNHIYLYQK